MLKPCAEPGCPELSSTTRCPTHTKGRERRRGSRQQRGYDQAHVKLRAKWARKVATGTIHCWRCGRRISALEAWDLGHLDDRSGYGGPECLPCNRSTSTRISPMT